MLARARQHVGSRTDIRLVQASAHGLPFKPGSFDRIMSGLVIDHVASPEQWFRTISSLLTIDGRAVIAAVHPDMQRLTGSDINIPNSQDKTIHIRGLIHEVDDLLAAAHAAGMAVVALEEPPVTPAMLERRPDWNRKLGRSALVLLALARLSPDPFT
jgi:cyclopropane fatty-acyl-phospholipid synthase-like methyltransferase